MSPHGFEVVPAEAPLDEDGRVGFSSQQNVPQPTEGDHQDELPGPLEGVHEEEFAKGGEEDEGDFYFSA